MSSDTIIMSLGGSLIVPEGINTDFLSRFVSFVREYVEKGHTFIIIAGGGAPARMYMDAIKGFENMPHDQIDTMGIHVTRLNAHLVRILLRDIAHDDLVLDPADLDNVTAPVVMGAGWEPGHSSDNDAVIMAEKTGAKRIINLSNACYVYDKDPKKYPDAQKKEEISWSEYRDLIPEEWTHGLNTPFDPIASAGAQRLGIEVVIAGPDIDNLRTYMQDGRIDGSIIR